MLGESSVRHEEEKRRLCRALHNLKRYMGKLDFIVTLKLCNKLTEE